MLDLDILSMLAISHMVHHSLFSITVLTWSLSTSGGLWMWSKKFPAWNFTNRFWHIWSVTATSPYTAQIFFFFLYISVEFLTFLEVMKHSMPKNVAFFPSIFNIKMATQKFANFDKFFFFKAVLTWQPSPCNLTKLFQMKVKTTKLY